MSFLPVTCDAARGLRCPKETCKRCTENRFNLSNPRGRTWTTRDQFQVSAPLAVVKQYHVTGNTFVKSFVYENLSIVGMLLSQLKEGKFCIKYIFHCNICMFLIQLLEIYIFIYEFVWTRAFLKVHDRRNSKLGLVFANLCFCKKA